MSDSLNVQATALSILKNQTEQMVSATKLLDRRINLMRDAMQLETDTVMSIMHEMQKQASHTEMVIKHWKNLFPHKTSSQKLGEKWIFCATLSSSCWQGP